jgi:hypothetical protein
MMPLWNRLSGPGNAKVGIILQLLLRLEFRRFILRADAASLPCAKGLNSLGASVL